MTTVVGLFDTVEDAQKAIEALHAGGIDPEKVGLLTQSASGGLAIEEPGETAERTAGLLGGALVGGLAGLVLGAVALAIPGIGPLVAAGPLAAVLTGMGAGAAVGGLAGSLREMGLPHEDVELYEEALRRGGVLVSAEAPDDEAAAVRATLQSNGARDLRGE